MTAQPWFPHSSRFRSGAFRPIFRVRIALYARVSSARQDPDNQLVQLRRWAADQGHEITGEFSDVVRGDSLFRPGLREMFATANECEAVAVVRPDRLARCPRVFASITAQLSFPVLTVEPCDVGAAVAHAAEDSRLLRERTKAGLDRARAEGVKIGRPRKITMAQRLAPRLARAAEGMRQLQEDRRL